MVTRKIYVLINYGVDEDGYFWNKVECFDSKEECKKHFDEQVQEVEKEIVKLYSGITVKKLHKIGTGESSADDRFEYAIDETAVSWHDWEYSDAVTVIQWKEQTINLSEETKIWEV